MAAGGRRVESLIQRIGRWFMPLRLEVQRAVVDARFVRAQGLPPTLASRLVGPPASFAARLRRRQHAVYQDVILAKYARLLPLHYAPGGRGYQTVAPSSSAERHVRYATQTSRLAYFADRYGDLLGYRDGDSFLDLGCGTGQSIRTLVERFPQSRVTGIDVNADALALIRECEPSEHLRLEEGSITDQRFLSGILTTGADHIVMSHVLSLLVGASAEETRASRHRLLRTLAETCTKSVVVIDRFGSRGEFSVEIEQVNRASVADDVLSYFDDDLAGRAFLVRSPSTEAILFIKDGPAAIG
ncbi:MAG: class I SAM-dependent methyltransferase [Actinomycetota bacterium]|nr:class I SAM-dependent methyltransferase [Actinomycetota bacterium]